MLLPVLVALLAADSVIELLGVLPAVVEAVGEAEAEEVAEPVKRAGKAKAEAAPAATKSVSDVLAAWSTDDDE